MVTICGFSKVKITPYHGNILADEYQVGWQSGNTLDLHLGCAGLK
jgi:hypothetical protein